MADRPATGDVYTTERTFTEADVREFAALSGDDQRRHVEPDEEGRLLVQGLLTATLPTAIGGDLEVLAYHMDFRFRRPVYTGETIACEWRCAEVVEEADRLDVAGDVTCTNEDGEVVLSCTVEGYVLGG